MAAHAAFRYTAPNRAWSPHYVYYPVSHHHHRLLCSFIIGSLASALYFLVKDKGQSERTVKALTLRVSLSLGLFLLLMAGFYFGILPPRP